MIDPEFIVKNYGADAVRLFILSDSPPEKDVQWSEQGMTSSYKFIQKLWTLHKELKNKISKEDSQEDGEEIEKFTNQMIAKITSNLEKFNYNVIIANMYETYNFLTNYIKLNKNLKNLEKNYVKILLCFSPVIPHFANECLEDIGFKDNFKWPEFNEALLEEEKINIVIQINGKKRSVLNTNKGLEQEDLIEITKKDKNISKYLDNKKINKIIFIKNKLVNILINE